MAIRITSSDEELVHNAQQGSLEAFTTLYERYLPMVYKRVRYVIPEQDVEDVTQEVFIAVIKSLRGFRCESAFPTWLRTLVNRQVADYYRRRRPPEVELEIEGRGEALENYPSLGAVDCNAAMDDSIVLRQALRALPDNYREILLLRFADGLRFAEIACVQGQSLEATKSLFRRAVAALQKHVEPANA